MSRVFEVWRSTGAVLVAADWPPHPTTGRPPAIDDDAKDEFIVLQYSLDDSEAAIEWMRVGGPARKDERFTMNLYVRTLLPGAKKRADVLDRLEALHDVAVALFSDGAGGWSAPWAAESWALALGGVKSVSARVTGGPEGWVGESLIAVQVAVR